MRVETADASGKILDTTALVAAAQGSHYVLARVAVAARLERPSLSVPVCALAEARARLDGSGRHRLARLTAAHGVVLDTLSTEAGERVGQLLGAARARAPGTDLVAAHVAFVARVRLWSVITAEPDRLLAIDAALGIDTLP